MQMIAYNTPGQAGQKLAQTVTTSEADVVVILDYKYAEKSQITNYFDVSLGSASAVNIRYYYSPDNGITWFQMPIKNNSTGVLVDTPTVLNSTSPADGGTIKTIEDFGFSAATAYKVTAQSVGANATINSLTVYIRDN